MSQIETGKIIQRVAFAVLTAATFSPEGIIAMNKPESPYTSDFYPTNSSDPIVIFDANTLPPTENHTIQIIPIGDNPRKQKLPEPSHIVTKID